MDQKASTTPSLVAISASEFANRFASSTRDHGQRFTWFMGAGCSVSSGIPAASGLVSRWLEELYAFQRPTDVPFASWTKMTFPKFDPQRPAESYPQVFGRRHPAPVDRQREIEVICARGEPAYGYATFAQLLSLEPIGQLCNTILTTNFDDLIADALYVYGERRARPQTITHEALARYVRIASPRPTIVKLHGDAHLDPKNLSPETRRINADVSKQLYPLLQDSALVFVGYGGNDESILHFFRDCPSAALAPQIYWVGKHDPAPEFRTWLVERSALRVEQPDFDRLMHHLRGVLNFDHPDPSRWDRRYKNYLQQYKQFQEEVKGDPDSEEKAALREASEGTAASLPDDWEIYTRATAASSREETNSIFQQGLATMPDSPLLHGTYAMFLDEAGDLESAERHYERAIELDPDDAGYLNNYAIILCRKNLVEAEKLFKRAMALSPEDEDICANYAQLLLATGRKAEGLLLLDQAMGIASDPGAIAEILFYRVAHDVQRHPEALGELKKLVIGGARSKDWDFSKNIDQARQDGAVNAELLEDLAKVIAAGAPVSILDRHPDWRAA